MEDSLKLIADERNRQITQEGWTPEHDDDESNGELAFAAAVYATPVLTRDKSLWPWDTAWYKPDKTFTKEGRIRELVKAGALILAEIDRLQRTIKKEENNA